MSDTAFTSVFGATDAVSPAPGKSNIIKDHYKGYNVLVCVHSIQSCNSFTFLVPSQNHLIQNITPVLD